MTSLKISLRKGEPFGWPRCRARVNGLPTADGGTTTAQFYERHDVEYVADTSTLFPQPVALARKSTRSLFALRFRDGFRRDGASSVAKIRYSPHFQSSALAPRFSFQGKLSVTTEHNM